MTTPQPITLGEFCTRNRISMTAECADANPNMQEREMDHWKVRFTRHQDFTRTGNVYRFHGKILARMTMYFSMGYGHAGKEPTAEDVLDCLASDASSVDQGSFDEWCRSFGYDEDSRTAERTYKACEKGAAKLKAFLGEDLYETLLYGTERL